MDSRDGLCTTFYVNDISIVGCAAKEAQGKRIAIQGHQDAKEKSAKRS
jgi:hypothetical protein